MSLLLIPAPSYTDGQTVFTLPAPLTVPCEQCRGRGRVQVGPAPTVNYGHGYGSACRHCTDGRVPYRGRIGIVVPCSTCEGAGVVERDDAFGGLTPTACPDCDGLGSLLVATATVADCALVVENDAWTPAQQDDDNGYIVLPPPRWKNLQYPQLVHFRSGRTPDDVGTDISDQLPHADFTPGRWAVLCEDVQPTTTRCPACWGNAEQFTRRDTDNLQAVQVIIAAMARRHGATQTGPTT